MVVIQCWGGLGNQMFQYALYQTFLHKKIDAKLDILSYKKDPAFNGYELERIFNVNANYISGPKRLFIKLTGKLFHKIFKQPYKESDSSFGFCDKKVTEMKFGFIKGYWQSENYFKIAEEALRSKFIFPPLTDEKNLAILKKIHSVNSVSLHIRRGDYLQNNRNWGLGIDYYTKAIDIINQTVTSPIFFVFSDDIPWAKENIKQPGAIFIDWNKGEKSYVDMQLMSSCKHNIIANSSFSWWGAWLNNNATKSVLAPDQWLPTFIGTREIIPNNWTKISVTNYDK